MFVIPVIDLMGGLVVRGVAGRRDEYRPIESQLVDEPTPRAVAAALARQYGFNRAYVADLDAIAGAPPNFTAYQHIAACGLTPWIDAGISAAPQARQLCDGNTNERQYIVGLESLKSIDELAAIADVWGVDHTIFSLDLKSSRPITRVEPWRNASAQEIAIDVVERGLRRIIVLDLADVGVGRGTGTLELVRTLHKAHPHLEIIAGGGVRGVDDLQRLADAGCHAALVASALHDGRLTREELAAFSS